MGQKWSVIQHFKFNGKTLMSKLIILIEVHQNATLLIQQLLMTRGWCY